ncbi:MAG: YraN family protein [Colwellia sp.]|nr:YraN family protein [Colwellia sp.]
MLFNSNFTTRKIGQIAEEFASRYLASQGLTTLVRNFQNRQGEIDLIMKDHDTFVFIEVKYRKNNNFGGAIAAIPYKKQQKIRQCAKFYLQRLQINEYNTPCRFDVVAVEGDINESNQTSPKITWLKNAF